MFVDAIKVFIEWVLEEYLKIYSESLCSGLQVRFGGAVAQSFHVTHRVVQRGMLSPHLFNLYTDVQAVKCLWSGLCSW